MSQPRSAGATGQEPTATTAEMPVTHPMPAAPADVQQIADTQAEPPGAVVVPPSGSSAAAQPVQAVDAPAPPPAPSPTTEYPPPPPPAGAAITPPPDAAGTVAPAGVAAPVPTPSRRRISYGPRARAALTGICLVTLSVLLLVLGVTLDFGGASLWSEIPLWSLFALVAALLGLLAFVPDAPGRGRLRPHTGWRIAVGGLVGLGVFWALVALPDVATDRGFVLTAALACLAGALWIAPSRNG